MTPNPKFSYAREKLVAARRILMLPHPKGEAESLAAAFHECDLGLGKLSESEFTGSGLGWLRAIRETMDATGIVDPHRRGTYTIKAERLTEEQKTAFSSAVDDLCYWLDDN